MWVAGHSPTGRCSGRRSNTSGIDTADAKAHFGYTMPDTRYFAGDDWPLESASMDLVLATETLEHVPNPAGFLAEASRCLKLGGQVLLTVPFAGSLALHPA